MAAGYLARRLGNRTGGLQVTLIELADIGIIGVGEGSFSSVKLALSALGVDEPSFLRECSATYKQGNKFVDWAQTPEGGRHSFYYHPFSAPTSSRTGLDLTPYWLLGIAGAIPFAMAIGAQHEVCEARRAPRRIDGPQYRGAEDYAYHFDAAKLAKVLGKVGEDLGVKRLDRHGPVCGTGRDGRHRRRHQRRTGPPGSRLLRRLHRLRGKAHRREPGFARSRCRRRALPGQRPGDPDPL